MVKREVGTPRLGARGQQPFEVGLVHKAAEHGVVGQQLG
jgi:hypothetical protein